LSIKNTKQRLSKFVLPTNKQNRCFAKTKLFHFFCLIDDILQRIDHKEDIRRQVSDSEIILTAIVSSTSFYGNHYSAIQFMKQYGFIPKMLDKSKFNRRLHKAGKLL
jgi:hypothetical protein